MKNNKAEFDLLCRIVVINAVMLAQLSYALVVEIVILFGLSAAGLDDVAYFKGNSNKTL